MGRTGGWVEQEEVINMKRSERKIDFSMFYCAARLIAAIFRTDEHTSHEDRWLAQRASSVLGAKFTVADIKLIRDALSAAYYHRYGRS